MRKALTISELIGQLIEFKRRYGDLPCLAQNGMDPSDFDPVREVILGEDEDGKPAVKIDAT